MSGLEGKVLAGERIGLEEALEIYQWPLDGTDGGER